MKIPREENPCPHPWRCVTRCQRETREHRHPPISHRWIASTTYHGHPSPWKSACPLVPCGPESTRPIVKVRSMDARFAARETQLRKTRVFRCAIAQRNLRDKTPIVMRTITAVHHESGCSLVEQPDSRSVRTTDQCMPLSAGSRSTLNTFSGGVADFISFKRKLRACWQALPPPTNTPPWSHFQS